jgi:hypothetical protein
MLQVRASQAHGIKVPPEFEDKGVIDTIVSAQCVSTGNVLADGRVSIRKGQL